MSFCQSVGTSLPVLLPSGPLGLPGTTPIASMLQLVSLRLQSWHSVGDHCLLAIGVGDRQAGLWPVCGLQPGPSCLTKAALCPCAAPSLGRAEHETL